MGLEEVAKKLRYRKGLLDMLVRAYGARTTAVLEAVGRAPREYTVRVNTLRTSPEIVIRELESMGVSCKQSPLLEEAVDIDVLGPFDVQKGGKQVVAEKSAAESVMMGSKLYGPGILRTDKYKLGEQVYVTDIYDHVVAKGIAVAPPKMDSSRIRGMAVDTKESIYRLPPLREGRLYREGLIMEQSLPAMMTSRALDPQKGETVVDMCAAPGGKALHLAQLMGGQGLIHAFDHSEKRLKVLRAEMERLGVRNVIVSSADSRYLNKDFPCLKADRVLVDPPCSALGVRPKLFEDATEDEVRGCARYQKQFLEIATKIVKRGGTVVYSTCTLTMEECEEIASFAIEELGLEPEQQTQWIGEPGLGGGTHSTQRFSPDRLETPGYFIAKFKWQG